ncbi:MAG TPA: NAD-dependent epimerase/dehydratase family protein [Bacteroidetes bacterium]|nr:NAD-dependent epimerase/dehydratase family protein [Bacteroidota bacterium]
MILVTGGTGFVGAHLLYHLLQSGKSSVRSLKRTGSSTEFAKKIFSCYSKSPDQLFNKIEWVDGDILDYYSLSDAFAGVDYLYHAAAVVSFHPEDKNKVIRTNIEGTANVVNAALEQKVKKMGYISSIGVLGRAGNQGLTDEETYWKTSSKNSLYSKSKYEAEREVWRGIAEGLDAVIVNPSIIVGPGNWNTGSPQIFQTMWKGLKFYTGGMNGFVDVNDVAHAMIMLTEGDFSGERYIINAENIRYKQFFEWMAAAMNLPAPKYKAGPLMSSAGWRLLKAMTLFTGKRSSITQESVRTANQVYRYSNQKFTEATGMKFMPVKESVEKTAGLFLKDYHPSLTRSS